MTIKELIQELSMYPETMEVMILDSFNGGGYPRDINLGPNTKIISKKDANETADCEGKIGEKIVYMGYGCY